MASSGFKILIADDDGASSRRFIDFLVEKGFEAQHASRGTEAKDLIKAWKPHFVIYDLTLEEVNAQQLLVWVKSLDIKDYKPKVIVTSGQSIIANIKECIRLGAVDYIVRPFRFEDMMTRLIFHIQNKREVTNESSTAVKLDGGDLYLSLLDVVMREALSRRPNEKILFNMAKMIALTLKAVRCNIVNVAEDLTTGTVLASSDDKSGNINGFVLDMNKYPEMLHVMNTEKPVVIEDLEYDPQLAKIKDLVKGISFNSIIVCPIKRNGEMFGVISARMDKNHSKFNDRDIKFTTLTAHIISLILSRPAVIPHEFYAPASDLPPKPVAEQPIEESTILADTQAILNEAQGNIKKVQDQTQGTPNLEQPAETKIITKKQAS